MYLLPNEIIDQIMLYSDKEDINNWKSCGIVSPYIIRRQYNNPYDAVKNGNLECFKFLIKNGFDITDNCHYITDNCHYIMTSITYICIDNDYSDIFEYISDQLINTIDYPTTSPHISYNINIMLFNSIECGNIKYIDRLIEKGAKINHIYCPMLTPIFGKNLELMKYLGKIGATQNLDRALEEAIIRCNIDFVKYLIEELGADIHYDNESALLWSISMKKNDITKYLVEIGADIHALNDQALYISARTCNIDITKYLIECGADIKTLANKDPITFIFSKPTQDVLDYYTELGARFA